jgi:hypothetical protein
LLISVINPTYRAVFPKVLHRGSPKIIFYIAEKLCLDWQGFFRIQKIYRPTEVDRREISVTASEVFL